MSTLKKNRFYEVDFLRLIVIVLLVAYHAFCPYAGHWEAVADGWKVVAYKWICNVSYLVMLETFTLISGYLFGYQMLRKQGEMSLSTLLLSKGQRLLLPSVLFGTIYLFLFKDGAHQPFLDNCKSILYGVGHMWYLPMLFTCFICTWAFYRFHLKSYIVIPLLFVLTSVSFTGSDILQVLDINPYYLLFFYLGFCIKAYSFDPMPYAKVKYILPLIGLSMVCYHIANRYRAVEVQFVDIPSFAVALQSQDFFRSLHSIPATIALYLMSMSLIYTKHVTLSQRLVRLTGMCFGVYLFQEFILRLVYYYSPIPQYAGPYLLPWIGFIAALILSLLFTKLFLSTKVGRWLIG
jgi:peptidoglycan/LPS O-acetylase OafA/YrhL